MNFFNVLRNFENINTSEGILEIDNKKFKIIDPDDIINSFTDLRRKLQNLEISQTEFLDKMFEYRSKKLTCFYFKSSGFNGRCSDLSYGKIIIEDDGSFSIKNSSTNRKNSSKGIFLILEEIEEIDS